MTWFRKGATSRGPLLWDHFYVISWLLHLSMIFLHPNFQATVQTLLKIGFGCTMAWIGVFPVAASESGTALACKMKDSFLSSFNWFRERCKETRKLVGCLRLHWLWSHSHEKIQEVRHTHVEGYSLGRPRRAAQWGLRQWISLVVLEVPDAWRSHLILVMSQSLYTGRCDSFRS